MEPQSGGSGPLWEKAGDFRIMLLIPPPNIKLQRPLHQSLHHFSPGALGRCQVLAPAAGSGRFVAPTGLDVIQATRASASFISAPKATASAHKRRCEPNSPSM